MRTCKSHYRRDCSTCKAKATQANPGNNPYTDSSLWFAAGYAAGASDSSSSCDTGSSSSYDSGSSSSYDSGSSYSSGDCGGGY